jgi:phage terminase Nu1 subunit (DNA packaging protein)
MGSGGAAYSRRVIAELLCRSEKRIKQLTDDGILEECAAGHYRLVPTVQAFIKYLDGLITDEDQASSYNTEKARLTKVKREDAELNLRVKKNELHRASDVEFIMTNMLVAFKSKLEVLPYKVLPSLINIPDGPEKAKTVTNILKDAISEALNELAGYDPEAFDSDSFAERLNNAAGTGG